MAQCSVVLPNGKGDCYLPTQFCTSVALEFRLVFPKIFIVFVYRGNSYQKTEFKIDLRIKCVLEKSCARLSAGSISLLMCLGELLLDLSRRWCGVGADSAKIAVSVPSCVICFPSTRGNLKNLPCVLMLWLLHCI